MSENPKSSARMRTMLGLPGAASATNPRAKRQSARHTARPAAQASQPRFVERYGNACLFTETNPLGQRQLGAVVDRGGLAAHVGFPRVAATFAAPAGGFLATERAAD